ncbi:uncharacterized protein LOC131675746 [Phymastichus coffea]|uniref:uncharacterized protein LOC131675746 n=1 Tax=Phymastichus coffea TaxID=108790 RepID=UPI00273CCFA1|nr:uncharacterized protein LOC131675746 [Phymastichus coffea]XP_058810844.1 uncharacterized protein LOC131675746 [Phymastichus coffea]
MFPVEIWEKILKNIDAGDLIRLKTVNSVWNAIISKYLQESDAWFKQCSKDVPQKYWLSLLENSLYLTTLLHKHKNLNDKSEYLNYKVWMIIYRAWVKWSNIESCNANIIDIFYPMPEHRPSEHITCCSTLGELVVIGSTEGYIRIFNLCSNKLVFRIDQYVKVLDVKLCLQGKNNDKIILIATSVTNKSTVWDITSQTNLMTMTGDVICAGYGYYCTTLCYDKILVHDAVNENSFPIRLFIKDYNMKPNKRYSNTRPIMKYVDMAINEQQLCFLSDTGLYCELNLQDISQSSKTLYTPNVTYIGIPKNHKIYRYYLFSQHVSFCITDRGYLGVSIHKKRWQMYNVYPFLEGKVTALTFHVRVLVFGLDSGDVCLFFAENILSLQALDFKSQKFKRIHVASEPIVCVNIMEIKGDQRLLVATKNTVYHIKF